MGISSIARKTSGQARTIGSLQIGAGFVTIRLNPPQRSISSLSNPRCRSVSAIMFIRILIVLGLLCPAIYAADAPPSDTSLNQLLEITHAHKVLDATIAQMDTMMKNVFQQVTAGRPASPQLEKIFEKAQAEVVSMCKEDLTWEKMEPMYLRIYRKSLSQSDVDGMIAFYKTPAGQAVINKMPLILQNTMAEVSQMMGPRMQRAERMQQDLIAELQAEKAKTGG